MTTTRDGRVRAFQSEGRVGVLSPKPTMLIVAMLLAAGMFASGTASALTADGGAAAGVDVARNDAAENGGDGGPNGAAGTPAAEELRSTARVRELCMATRPEQRVHFEDEKDGPGRQREQHRHERRRLLRQLYKVRVPIAGFRLSPYVAETGELPLDSSAPIRTLHGALTLSVPSDESAIFVLTPPQAKRVAELAAGEQLRLDYFFLLSDDMGSPCQGSVATQVFSLSTTPVAFMLLGPEGEVIARDETLRADAHREALGGFSGVPGVFVGPVTSEPGADAPSIARRLEAIQEPLKTCYEKRIVERPGAAGTVVLGVGVGAAGAVQTIDVIADALNDPPLLKCIEQELNRVRFAGVRGLPTLFRLPVELRRVPARGTANPPAPAR